MNNASFQADAATLRLPASAIEGRVSLDVRFDGHRVWSFEPPEPRRGGVEMRWPLALRPYLRGRTALTVADSASGDVVAETSVAFTWEDAATDVTDADGRLLSVNKWGRMGKTFEGSDAGMRTRLLDRLDELVTFCLDFGLDPFIVGGTLLGAVREGHILGHDDDADVAYLSAHTHPSDVALENFRIERALVARGLEVIRHSTAHLQVTFRSESGRVDAYVDLFTAFFREDGTINQPFHVRGEMMRSAMLPFSSVTLEGRQYPAPHDTNAWLTVNYDESWRTPQPGYRLRTPRATARRFRNWFGSSNFKRDFWEEHHASETAEDPPAWSARTLDALLPPTSRVLDLGSGSGASAVWLASRGHRVIGVDYSPIALANARERGRTVGVEVEWRRLNLIELRQVADLLAEMDAANPTHVLIEHLIERMGHLGRGPLWRVVRQAVRHGGRALAVVHTRPAADVSFRDPTTWHLEVSALKAEMGRYGLGMVQQRLVTDTQTDRERRALAFEISLAPLGEPARGTH